MNDTGARGVDLDLLRKGTELAVRLILVGLLVYWCYAIIRPFLMAAVLGVVLAVALYPLYAKLEKMLSGRKKLAAVILVVACLAALLVPVVFLSESLVDGVRGVSARVREGTIAIPPAPERVAEWPVIGKPLYEAWTAASTNLAGAAERLQPQILKAAMGLVSIAKQGVGAALLAAVGLVIAGFFWVRRDTMVAVAYVVARRVGGPRGEAIVPLARDAISTVAKGVVGVAAIQAVLAAAGLVVAGVPGAGLWALLVLVFAVAQLPPIIVLAPAILYVVATNDSKLTAVLFGIWCFGVSFSDALLKPLLMGRGSKIPVAVILIGAIGGLILHGLIGLFIGAVVFSIGYELISDWVRQGGLGGPAGTGSAR